MTKPNLANDVIALLQVWSKKVAADIGAGGIYLFGSLVHRAGEQFGAASDVDLVVVFPDDADNTKKRAAWLNKLLSHKQSLEAELAQTLERKTDKTICSVVAVTKHEIVANLHKDGATGFFSENQFRDLLEGAERKGLPDAGAKAIDERLATEALRFAQKKRHTYLAVRPDGAAGLTPFKDEEPLPKDIARAGAMVAQLREPIEEAGAEYDTQRGLDFLFNAFYEIQKRNQDYRGLFNALSIRRGARGDAPDLSAAEQILIVETVASLALQHLAELQRMKAEQMPRLREQPTVFFAKRIAQAFPGVRGIRWFEDKDAIKTCLEKLLAKPLKFADASPIWWWRGHSCMHIEDFEYQKDCVFLMDGYELLVSRLAAVVPGPYNRSFVYVELAPMEPTGLYPETAECIAEVKAGKSDLFPYYGEEYGLVDGRHLVTRSEYDDGAATIGGELQDIIGRNELRSRYVTPFNFVIAPEGNPIDNPAMDEVVEKAMNAMLKGQDCLPRLMELVLRAPLGRRYGE